MGERPLLEVEELTTTFVTGRGATATAVDRVSFDLEEGRTLGIVGESGSGKSVLVRSIMGLLDRRNAVSTGRIRFDGTDVRATGPRSVRRLWGREMAMVFQDPLTSLNPTMRIGEHVAESLRHHLKMRAPAARARAVDLLGQVGIPDPARRARQYPHELSGGMRQRVTIAIALACQPRLLIADEPTTALDVTVQRQILDLLGGLQREHGMAMILISHDLGVVAGRADRVGVMYAGRMVETAETADLFAATRHPYSNGLLASIPRIDRPSHERLATMGGGPPDLRHLPAGCPFTPRCPRATDRCGTDAPELTGDDHRVACWHPVDDGALASAG